MEIAKATRWKPWWSPDTWTILINAGVRPESVAVITPYNGQLALLSRILREKYPGLELGSVDGFQGREKEAVVVSLVRSNAEREVGFLGEKRRLNGMLPPSFPIFSLAVCAGALPAAISTCH